MSNFNEDRRQGCVDFECEPYRDNWKDKKIYNSIKYTDYLWWGGGVVIIIVTAQIVDVSCRSSVSEIELKDLLLMS